MWVRRIWCWPRVTDPQAASLTCGDTYGTSSVGQPAQVYAVSATAHWAVTLSGQDKLERSGHDGHGVSHCGMQAVNVSNF